MPPRRPKSLSSTRPPLVRSRIEKPGTGSSAARTPTASTAARATRTIIRRYHVLQKELAQAEASESDAKVAEIEARIEELGGLNAYQRASLTGQKKDRGGDSSKVLVDWLKEGLYSKNERPEKQEHSTNEGSSDEPVSKRRGVGKSLAMRHCHVLEVGSLSPDNAISSFVGALNAGDPHGESCASIQRIDLHSQHPSILTQDFMERPLPGTEAEKFDVISLSLVLNYVPDAVGRGEMLKRTCQFLRHRKTGEANVRDPEMSHTNGATSGGPPSSTQVTCDSNSETLPSLFLVLPAPCVENSRYLTDSHLSSIMASLGYSLARRKISAKLAYYLWHWHGCPESRSPGRKKEAVRSMHFAKKEIHAGKGRNNFCIILR